MKTEFDRIKDTVVRLVTEARNQRLRPHEIEKSLGAKIGGSMYTVQQALNDLVREGRLVFTFREPWDYVELPGAVVWPEEARIPRNRYEQLKEDILAVVEDAENQRLRPHEVKKKLAGSVGGSIFSVQQALNNLVREGRLVFSYRDPCSFVELPALKKTASA